MVPFTISLTDKLPLYPKMKNDIRRAPRRKLNLSKYEIKIALKNALRYIPKNLHPEIAAEFAEELKSRGRIYGYRYRPVGRIYAKPIDEYEGNCLEGKAIQLMIDNNLDFEVALYPYELVTYGETGQVCQNWMQYLLIKKYLQFLTKEQTLVVESGHPLGLFKTHENAPRVINTNGLLVGIFDNPENFNKAAAMGVSNYGQMTAGGWMYIGPQGIVHGTYITILNAGRKYLEVPADSDLKGYTYLSSGLGGMSGAQAKAIEIAGGVGIIAEVDETRIKQRIEQGWLSKSSSDIKQIFRWLDEYKKKKEPISIGYYGNIVDLWEYVLENNLKIDLSSDQTSCHAPYSGGYTPQGVTFEEGRELLSSNPKKFKELVDKSLVKQFTLIKEAVERGTRFWDYGNSFMKAVFDAGSKDITRNKRDTSEGFIFPSYVEDLMGPLCFDYGYGPFRWVCLSGKQSDLVKTDDLALSCINPNRRVQDMDNYKWVKDAIKNNLVVGSQARILYADHEERILIALNFNEAIRKGEIGPIMLGRDHHDTGSTDSPFRETSNIKDGSNITADMAVHSFVGNAIRGMSMVVLSNGGGVGIGKAFNGGFGLVLDGSKRVDEIIKTALEWDVIGGIARRAWTRNPNALEVATIWNDKNKDKAHITIPYIADDDIVDRVFIDTGF
ncbi:urocanate hydratase [candidate division WOR-3 bacterium]|nr:urocanate hydratase [candidate division WOR-3 bacterium]